MKKIRLLYICLSIAIASGAQIKQSQSISETFTESELVETAIVSASFIDISTQEELLSINSKTSVVPASVLKLVTTASALEFLGEDFKFKTSIYADGLISDGILNGNLVIVGGGDPTLGSSYFDSKEHNFLLDWVLKIKQAGIDSITGSIVVDPSIYVDQDVPKTWVWEDLGNYYGAAAQGISLYDNMFYLYFNTENRDKGTTQIVRTEPSIQDLHIENLVKSSSINRDQAYIFGSTFDSYRQIRGSLPMGRQNFKVKASIPDPSVLLGTELKSRLYQEKMIDADCIVLKKATDSDSTYLTTIYEHLSPTLSQIIRELNFHSVNLFAEHLCKHIGLKTLEEGSTIAGCKSIESFWKLQGIGSKGLFLADGSGLSRVNAISASTLAKVLVNVTQKPYYKAFENSIPLVGIEGTIANYFVGSPIKGKARIKTGSMTRVRSFAGYMTTQKGKNLAFAVMVNNYNGASADMVRQMEQLINNVYLNY